MSDPPGPRKTICLTMIVKNEAHLIINTFKHLAQYIKFDYWAINDNGSTDGTQDLIRNYFKEQGIPGTLDETPWRDFAYNRTAAFKAAFGKADYAFVWDADDEIYGNFKMPENLTADSYLFTYGNAGGTRYSRCQLFNNRLQWKYVGVLHEYPTSADGAAKTQETIAGDYYFISGRTGARNRDPDKYLNDAKILEKAFNEEFAVKGPLYCRYAFYTAQSYNSCNQHEKAIEYYKKVVTFDTWHQEKYMSCLEIYEQYALLKQEEEGLRYLVEAHRFDSRRVECIYRLVKYYCIKGLPEVSLAYYTLIQDYYENEYVNDNIANRLFAHKDEYDFYLPYYMIISCDRTKRMDIFKQMYEMIFRQKHLCIGAWWIHNLFHNLQFGIPSGDPAFVESMLTYVDLLRKQGIDFTEAHYDIMDKVIVANRPMLGAPIAPLSKPKETSAPRVMLTVTTCKRLPLFQQTMNSMMRTWKDISAIDYFFCVDDNSSAEDRHIMRTTYPFFDYYMKGADEKGHRESMNIIWNKIKEVQPTYWIHMEDDWLYFKQENYVTRAISLLEKYEAQNIHQVVFNREYGLMMNDMKRTSGQPLEPGVWLHTQTEVQGPNCAYWPHYSIQPSVIRANKILELGNYDSPNTFFERDYANKYGAAGYKTMFFDGIYSLHIGKQHWEKDGMNAYALNEVGQFAKKEKEDSDVPRLEISEIPKNEPLHGSMADHLEQIIQKIKINHPFGLIRPSDGEHKILSNKTLTNCDKWTYTEGGGLREELMSAIQTVDPNLYIGIPCNTCNHPWNCTQEIYDDYVTRWKVPAGQRTYANVFGNANWARFSAFLRSYTNGLYVVTSGTQPTTDLVIKDRFVISEKLVDRWDSDGAAETERLLQFIGDKQGQLICFSAGPLSKVWIPRCMKANPANIYLDVGASIDLFTKGATNRGYTIPNTTYSKEICRFNNRQRSKNLIYMCVFNETKYVDLLRLLMTSIRFFCKAAATTYDFLVITNPDLGPAVKEVFRHLDLPLFMKFNEPKHMHEALCGRYTLFDYADIGLYERILYLDTDIVVQGDLAPLFTLEIEDKIHALPEGTIEHAYHGGHLFDLNTVDKDTPGMNSGILLFKNTETVRMIFTEINAHIQRLHDSGEPIGIIVDQAFLNFHTVSAKKNETTLLTKYAMIYAMDPPPPPSEPTDIILCHFVWPIGEAENKLVRMNKHMKHLFDNIPALYSGPSPTPAPLKKYTWSTNGTIAFEHTSLRTTWSHGIYAWINSHMVEATWSGFAHILRMNEDYSGFISVRKGDLDCVLGQLIV